MATFNPYLHFTGNAEEAFRFYRSVFGGEFIRIMRYGEMPPCEDIMIPEDFKDKIMHISLPLGKNNILMGSDAMSEMNGRKFSMGDNFHIAISAESREEAETFFNNLSEGGRIDMPLADSFWGSYFGMLVDRYGIQWTVEYETDQNLKY